MINKAFLVNYLSEVALDLVSNLEKSSGSRFAGYSILIQSIYNKDIDALDKADEGDTLYVACNMCSDVNVFWSTLTDRVRSCIELDIEDNDLNSGDGNLLLKMLS